MLKLCPEKIAVPLQIIFNKSLLQCKYPTSWMIAHVIAHTSRRLRKLPHLVLHPQLYFGEGVYYYILY
jgi:hypothetical protein